MEDGSAQDVIIDARDDEPLSPKFGNPEPVDEEEELDVEYIEPDNYSDEELELKKRYKRIIADFSWIGSWFTENLILRWARRARTGLESERKPE